MSYQVLKRRAYEILEKGHAEDSWSRRVDIFIIILIVLNILAVILESVKWLKSEYGVLFNYVETSIVQRLSLQIKNYKIKSTSVYCSMTSTIITGSLDCCLSFEAT